MCGHRHCGGAIASLLGGWDTALQTLIIFMAIDYITGLIVAGVFHTSPKTKTGTLESRAGWKGLCRKGVSLLVVLVACRLDAVIRSNLFGTPLSLRLYAMRLSVSWRMPD